MRNRFDQQLSKLNDELTELGALCEAGISLTVSAFINHSADNIKKVHVIDSEINQIERKIEGRCLKMLLQQQPVARDLRHISAALKMITDMERIGDQAADIADIVSYMTDKRYEECDKIMEKMSVPLIKMVTDSVEAYIKQDFDLAEKVIKSDDIIDDYFVDVRKTLIEMIQNKSIDGEYAIDILMIAKYFEKIGDHATNIAEWVQFSITGVHKGEVEL